MVRKLSERYQENQEVILTIEGYRKLEKELDFLKSVKRREIAERIRQAIDFGDLSENSEYEDAKNEQAFNEGRIITLEKKLRFARIIDHQDVNTKEVSLGCKVVLEDLDSQETYEYIIVGSMEADPAQSKISNESPVGKALLGKKTGEIVRVQTPDGETTYRILELKK